MSRCETFQSSSLSAQRLASRNEAPLQAVKSQTHLNLPVAWLLL